MTLPQYFEFVFSAYAISFALIGIYLFRTEIKLRRFSKLKCPSDQKSFAPKV